MSETNQEEVQQNENEVEYDENDNQIDQNHEEEAEFQPNGENIINPQEEEETNETNQEFLDQQHTDKEEEENQIHDLNNEEDVIHNEEENLNEEVENDNQEVENDNQEVENDNHEVENDNHEVESDNQEVENDNQEVENDNQEVENDNQEVENDNQEVENENEIQEPKAENVPTFMDKNREKDITEMSIKELRAELDKSITQLDFVKAQTIQEEINSRSTQNHSQLLDEAADKFIDECEKIAKNHYKLKHKLQKDYTKKEIEERTNMDDGFQELKNLHIDQLQELENNLFNIYKDKMKKPIATYDELIERAKKTAKRGDFSSAQDYQLQAQRAKDDEENKREELFKEEYKAKMNALLDKQSQEITAFGVTSSNEISKLLKVRDEAFETENERFKREMNRLYRKTCDTITHSRYNPKNPKQQAIDPKVKPSLLNRIEDTYNDLLVKYGIQSDETTKKPKMIAPNIRPESKMSVRMQSRVEMRETEKKKKEDETFSRSNSRMSSRAASRSASKQTSPKQSPRSNNNSTRRSVLSPSKF